MSVKKGFEEIIAWQKARQLVKNVYEVSSQGAFRKDFGLRDQVRRASVSVMSNIAEGYEREGDKEFAQFLSQAKASCGEVRSQLYVALDMQYIQKENFEFLHGLATETSRVISGLMKHLRSSSYKGSKFK